MDSIHIKIEKNYHIEKSQNITIIQFFECTSLWHSAHFRPFLTCHLTTAQICQLLVSNDSTINNKSFSTHMVKNKQIYR